MTHRYGDPCTTCGEPALNYNTATCDDCRHTEERSGTDRLSQLYAPGKATVLARLQEPSDAETPIVLDVQGCGDDVVSYRTCFATEDQALAYMDAHSSRFFAEVEVFPVPDSCERLLTRLYPKCSHGMSLALCFGPQHYASDEEIAQGW